APAAMQVMALRALKPSNPPSPSPTGTRSTTANSQTASSRASGSSLKMVVLVLSKMTVLAPQVAAISQARCSSARPGSGAGAAGRAGLEWRTREL
ncbi:hypothetical protein MCOR07_002705, partial [Pyricularia oryzae]